jgi:putative peptidoglycan lipid II flippase
MSRAFLRPPRDFFSAAWRNLLLSGAGAVLNYLSFVVVAYLFGATSQTDIFLFGLSFVLVLSSLVTTVFGGIFLPLYIRLLHQPDGNEVAEVFCDAFLVRLLGLAIPVFFCILFAPAAIFGLMSKFPVDVLTQNQGWLWAFAPTFMCMVFNEFLRVVLQAREGFSAASASVVLQALVNLILMVVLAHWNGISAMVIAAVLSRLFQLSYLVQQLRRIGVHLRLRLVRSTHVAEFTRLAGPYWIASIVSMVAVFFYDYVASGLPAGQLTAVAFAQKIYMLPFSMLAMPLIEILNTRMSTLYAHSDRHGLSQLYLQSLTLALLMMLPLGLAINLNAQAISEILLSRGAYAPDSLSITARTMSIYALALPCLAVFAINGRISLVFQMTRIPSLFGSFGHLLSMCVVWFLVGAFGYIGLAWAKLSIELAYFLPFGFLVVQYCMPVPWRGVLRSLLHMGFSAILAYAISWAATGWLLGYGLPGLFVAFFSSAVLLAVFFSLCRLLGVATHGLFDALRKEPHLREVA